MNRIPVNPWPWSIPFGFNQGEVVEGQQRTLYCAGQTAIDGEGQPQHLNDLRAQLGMALDNLEAVLRKAEMTLANIVRLTVYTTDVEAYIENVDLLGARLATANVRPVQTLLGVAGLAFPGLTIELEATAVA